MFKKALISVLALLVISSLMVPYKVEAAKKKVAIMPFEDGSLKKWWTWEWEVGKGVSDMFVTSLVKQGRFSVIEREQLEKILAEQKLGLGGFVDASTAASVGKILGVNYIIMGKITEFSCETKKMSGGKLGKKIFGEALGSAEVEQTVGSCSIDARMIDTTTAEIVSAETGKGDKKETGVSFSAGILEGMSFTGSDFENTILGQAIREACNNLAAAFCEAVGQTGEIVKVKSDSLVYIDLIKEDGVKVGARFMVQRPGEEMEIKGKIIREMEDIGVIEVTEVRQDYSEAKVVSKEAVGRIQKGDKIVGIKKK